ncbi:MAG TPA: hypothetical protein VFS60_18350, partial [Thermoanaerobaculia bacterium]|nr:hypothetical protein [Thermoanaerobaculia bacterium]
MKDDGDDLDGFDDPDQLDDLDEPVAADPAVSPPHGDRLTGTAAGIAAADRAEDLARQAFLRGGRGDGEVAPMRMLAFYDRLRGRVVAAID